MHMCMNACALSESFLYISICLCVALNEQASENLLTFCIALNLPFLSVCLPAEVCVCVCAIARRRY